MKMKALPLSFLTKLRLLPHYFVALSRKCAGHWHVCRDRPDAFVTIAAYSLRVYKKETEAQDLLRAVCKDAREEFRLRRRRGRA